MPPAAVPPQPKEAEAAATSDSGGSALEPKDGAAPAVCTPGAVLQPKPLDLPDEARIGDIIELIVKELLLDKNSGLSQHLAEHADTAEANEDCAPDASPAASHRAKSSGEPSESLPTTSSSSSASAAPLPSKMVAELVRGSSAVVNIQQLPEPRRRLAPGAFPFPDAAYECMYSRWRNFLRTAAPTGAAVSGVFGRAFLQSLMLSNYRELLRDLRASPLAHDSYRVFRRLGLEAGITAQVVEQLLVEAERRKREQQSDLPSESGLGFLQRDAGGAREEASGILGFTCLSNDRQPAHLMQLVTSKNIFSRQLPKMPREYIVRLVFDRNHFTFCLVKNDTVIGGVCFRPYYPQRFAEIAFLAITSVEQVKGYGTRLMNHLKEHVKKAGIEYFLTYADNFAIGYFRKQGFSQTMTMPRERWFGYIKDYDGGTLMECKIEQNINYLRVFEMLTEQKKAVQLAVQAVKPLKVYPGLLHWKDERKASGSPVPCESIPGLLESGWRPSSSGPPSSCSSSSASSPFSSSSSSSSASSSSMFGSSWASSLTGDGGGRPSSSWSSSGGGSTSSSRAAKRSSLKDQIMELLQALDKQQAAWPFRRPVSTAEAPDYYDVIENPTDLSTMKKKCKQGEYRTRHEFGVELRQMLDNCRIYNAPQTIYYKYANELEAYIKPRYDAISDV
eukprot:GHVT01066730.1.p1 GENE.GHVT01066730.1~~GHVT01066730.1.p1  ORF type:complete len:674 (+),score=192.13 GHVT01066730.1:405-2426(+)